MGLRPLSNMLYTCFCLVNLPRFHAPPHQAIYVIFMLAPVLFATVCLYTFWQVVRRFSSRSSLRALAGPPSQSLLTGNLGQLFHPDGWQFHGEIAEKYGGVIKTHGWLGAEQVYVSDPKALYHILIKDQHIYEEAPWFLIIQRLYFGKGLTAMLGEDHRRQRKMLNPVFSINHMRHMTPIFYSVAHRLRDAIAAQLTDEVVKVDLLHWLSRASLEFMGQGGYGYSFDSLDPKEDTCNPYALVARDLSVLFTRMALVHQSLPFVIGLASPSVLRSVANFIPSAMIQKTIKTVDTMHATMLEVFKSKKEAFRRGDKAALAQLGDGKDIMSVLMRNNMEASEDDRLPDDELLGQMSLLTFAGFDTTSSALAKIIHILAHHPEAQDRLREEVTTAREFGGDLAYDDLGSLPYLDAVCRETMRLFPPVPVLWRTVRKDVVLPMATPVKSTDGKTYLDELFLKEGTDVFLGLVAANQNKAIWGLDAGEWKPERWLSPLPSSVTEAHIPGVYSHLLTFIAGSRACIGFKFAELEMKIVLSLLLETFVFTPADDVVFLLTVITTPTVKARWEETKDPFPPSLPMNVSLVSDAKFNV